MSTGSQRRTRSDLIAGLSRPWHAAPWLERTRSADVLKRVGLCLLSALAMWGTTGAWNPPFGFRVGDTPGRNVVARTAFSVDDEEETASLRRRARAMTLCIYENDKLPLVELRRALKDSVFRVTSAESLDKLDAEAQKTWADFLLPDHRGSKDVQPAFQYPALLGRLDADQVGRHPARRTRPTS